MRSAVLANPRIEQTRKRGTASGKEGWVRWRGRGEDGGGRRRGRSHGECHPHDPYPNDSLFLCYIFIVVTQSSQCFSVPCALTLIQAPADDGANGTAGERSREKTDAIEMIIAAAAAKASKRNWDVSALLNDDQREAVSVLSELMMKRPLARAEWNELLSDGAEEDERAEEGSPEELSIAALYCKLGEAQEAAEVFNDDDMEDVKEHHERMVGIVQLCDKIVGLLTIVEKTLVGVQTQHDSVVDKTSALHAECETLLADKLELEALANSIENRLKVPFSPSFLARNASIFNSTHHTCSCC